MATEKRKEEAKKQRQARARAAAKNVTIKAASPKKAPLGSGLAYTAKDAIVSRQQMLRDL